MNQTRIGVLCFRSRPSGTVRASVPLKLATTIPTADVQQSFPHRRIWRVQNLPPLDLPDLPWRGLFQNPGFDFKPARKSK
jgi:hypothetical protein